MENKAFEDQEGVSDNDILESSEYDLLAKDGQLDGRGCFVQHSQRE